MNTVYFLGAGASAAAAQEGKHVLTDDFLRVAFQMGEGDPRLERVRDFVHDFFRYDADDQGPLPTAEEVLSAVDLALERSEALSTEYTRGELQDLRRHFALLIYLVLEEAYRELGNHVTDRFVGKLGECPTVISLNYDIIIDYALCRRFTPGRYDHVELDYGIDYRVYLLGAIPSPEFARPGPVKLFKMHGSLNWAVCPTCGVVYVGPPLLGKSVRYTFDEYHPARCSEEDHAPLEPLLITPTYLKSYARPQLSLIWQRAERAIREASRVVFIGYSLPDADYHIKYLLQKAMYRRQPPQIVVVDSKPTDVDRPTVEETRYKRLFGSDITYYMGGFAKYVDEDMEEPGNGQDC